MFSSWTASNDDERLEWTLGDGRGIRVVLLRQNNAFVESSATVSLPGFGDKGYATTKVRLLSMSSDPRTSTSTRLAGLAAPTITALQLGSGCDPDQLRVQHAGAARNEPRRKTCFLRDGRGKSDLEHARRCFGIEGSGAGFVAAI